MKKLVLSKEDKELINLCLCICMTIIVAFLLPQPFGYIVATIIMIVGPIKIASK